MHAAGSEGRGGEGRCAPIGGGRGRSTMEHPAMAPFYSLTVLDTGSRRWVWTAVCCPASGAYDSRRRRVADHSPGSTSDAIPTLIRKPCQKGTTPLAKASGRS